MSNPFKSAGRGIKGRISVIAATVALSGAAALMPMAAVADHNNQHTINQLLAQIAALQSQLQALQGGTPPPSGAAPCSFTRNLSTGSEGQDVWCLQVYLNSAGFTVASTGAGSPGNETTYFGARTKAAVISWQNANVAQVLRPVGLSAGTGFWGSSSRNHYNTLVSAYVPPPPPPPPPPPGASPLPPGASPAPVPAGSGLTVSAAASQPAESLAPYDAARIPATRITLTASADGDVTVKSLTVERQGLADDAAIDSVILLDEENVQIGLSKTLNAVHQATLNEPFMVKAGTTKTYTVAFNRAAAGSLGGQIAKFAVVAVDAGTSAVNGSFPIVGSGMTINETLAIGSLASPAVGSLDPGAARTSLEVGTVGFIASGLRWTVGSAEPVILEQIRFYQAGSAATGDIKNVKARVKDVDYNAMVSSDGKFYTAKFVPGVEFDKGAIIDISVKVDVDGGSDRTIDFDLQKRTDIVARGKTYNYYMRPANGSATNSSTQGEGFTSSEPYYDAYLHTIAKGSLRVERGTAVSAGNVGVDAANTALGSFAIEAKGEKVQISSFLLTFTLSAGEEGTQIDNVAIYDKNGAVVAGPKDVNSSEQVTFTDTWTVPTGLNEYTIKGKLTTDFEDADTVVASVDPDGDITAKGETTGLTITASPTTAVSSHTMTVRRASLSVSVASTPGAQNVVRGVNGYLFATIQYDAGSSGEDLRITKQELTVTTSGSADMDHLNSCQLFDGTLALNTGGNVVNPSGNAVGADAEISFTLDNNIIVPKGTAKNIDVKCNISSSAAQDETWSIGIADTDDDTTVVGRDTAASVTESVTINVGPTMTVREKGTLEIALDVSSASERYGVAGKADVASSIFKLTSKYEPLKLTKFGFALASSTASTSDIVKLKLWDGATQVGEAVMTGGNFLATSTLTSESDFIVPKDSDKILKATVDLIPAASLAKANATGGDSGHLVVINSGYASTTYAIGQASGNTIWAGTKITDAKGVRVVKGYPTLERLSVPTNTLANGDMDLYRFKITAPADGDIGLFRFTFRVSSTTVATTSSFRVFAYTDSGFSSQAYAVNPINANDVDCVGSSTKEASANDSCLTNGNDEATGQQPIASTSHVAIFFDPVTNDPAIPGLEAINIPAGASRYFRFVGDVTKTTTGDSFSVALLGDSAFIPTLTTQELGNSGSGIARDTLSSAYYVATTSNRFVWSPNTTSTSATTTNDWLTGYLLPGLPSTEMSQQTFSK